MNRNHLKNYLDSLFSPHLFDDYCPNGLQIEGKETIKKIFFSVSATKDSVEQAADYKADALIVHHGLFWKFHGTRTITDTFYRRISPIIKSDINLFAYHLPLDGHLEIGNAKSLADAIGGLTNLMPFGNHKGMPTGVKGRLKTPLTGPELKKILELTLDHGVLYSDAQTPSIIESIGIITGGANSQWLESKKEGLDAYITGEMSEHDYHESRESNVHMFAGGHHATEKFGIISLMNKIKKDFPELECLYIDSNNPA